MMAYSRYYLIPTDPEPEKQGCALCPKYIDLFRGDVDALPPKETTIVAESRTWLRPFFVIKIRAADRQAFTELEMQADVIPLRLTEISRLEAVGIEVTNVVTVTDLERRVVAWLTEKDRPFWEVLPLRIDEVLD